MLVKLKYIGIRAIKLSFLYGLLFGGILPLAWSKNVPPEDQRTVIEQSIDRMALPKKLFIWNSVFGGSSDFGNCDGKIACIDNDMFNSLLCLSRTNVDIGACPTTLHWINKIDTDNSLKLRFTHSSGQTKELRVISLKQFAQFPSWYPMMPLASAGFTTYITEAELRKLSLPGVWKAALRMRVSAWDNCGDDVNGCIGAHRAMWHADITLNVTDTSNQQIYLPAFPTSAPVINLNLNSRPGAAAGSTVSGKTHLDMCLYDGNDSASNRISLRLQDEGASALGQPSGQFSVYRRGGDKSRARDRLDYQVSVINPTTGAAQSLSNGTEIIWSDTNRRNILRQVILPGGNNPALCVPAPLTLKTPAFALSSKAAGNYTGTLRIIYTPSTQ